MKSKMSVKLRLTIGFVILFLLMTGVFVWFLLAISHRVYLTTQEADLKELLNSNLQMVEGYKNGRLVISDGFLYDYSGIKVAVYNEDKALIAGQIPDRLNQHPTFENGAIRGVEGDGEEFLVLDIYYPFDWDTGVWIRGMSEMTDQTRVVKNLMIAALVTLPLFLSIVALLSNLISRSALKPLDKINELAKQINSGEDLSQRINIENGPQEFVDLSLNMDNMLESLEMAFEKEKRFTSDVSHELRTPISIISGAAEYSLKYDEKDEWKESMETIHRNARQMKDMVEGLLDISRLENGKIGGKLDRLNISSVAGIACQDLAYEIETDIEEGLFILGDETLILRLINNLVENAHKYGRENGHIWLRLISSEDRVELSVRDDGIGIPKEKQKYIFDRFYQVDESRSDRIKGTGLGLAMVSEIVKLHKATIEVESVQEVGTVFRIFFKKAQ